MISYPTSELNPSGKPTPKQAIFHASPAKYRWFQGGWGSGKTFAGAVETACYIADYPGTIAFIGRMNDKALKKSTWRTFYEEILPDDVRAASTHKKTEKILILPDGITEIHYDHLENPWRFGSVPYDFVWIDECCEPGSEEAIPWLKRALRGRGHHKSPGPKRGIFTGSPRGRGDLYKMFYEDNKDSADYFVVNATMEDNPYLDKAHIEEMRRDLRHNPVKYKRNFLGEFAEFEGQQFPTFEEAKHVEIERPPTAPEDWIVYCAIDPAIRTTGAVWAAQSPHNNDVYVFREYTGEGRTVAENAANILEMSADCGVDVWVIDRKASEQRNVETGTTMMELWQENGIFPEPSPDKTTNPSVVRLNQLFAPYDEEDPSIKVHWQCENLIEQLNSALWETRISMSRHTETRRPGEFHHLDCLQYIVQVLNLPYQAKREEREPTVEDKCFNQAMKKVKRELTLERMRVKRLWL